MDVFLNLTVSFYLPENSVSKAKKLADFLHEDLQKVIAKHVRGTSAEDLLHLAVYLDPRFRNHARPRSVARPGISWRDGLMTYTNPHLVWKSISVRSPRIPTIEL